MGIFDTINNNLIYNRNKNREDFEKNKIWYIVGSLLFVVGVTLFLFIHDSIINKKESELIEIENTIILDINKGDDEKALFLIGKLVNPSDQTDSSRPKGNGYYYTYNEWWSKRREELRDQILKAKYRDTIKIEQPIVTQHKKKRLAKKNKSTSQTKSAVIKEKKQEEPSLESNRTPNSEPSIIEKKQEEQIAAIDYSYFERYLGIYSIQYDNGNTRMFKFSMNLSNNNLNVLYQDNISGNSKIEMYKLLNFDQSSGRIVLESKNNSNEKTRLYLKTDAESKNGYKLVDENSVEYTFLLKD